MYIVMVTKEIRSQCDSVVCCTSNGYVMSAETCVPGKVFFAS